jgi:hypothetical protein
MVNLCQSSQTVLDTKCCFNFAVLLEAASTGLLHILG